jgi:hypothetical protein
MNIVELADRRRETPQFEAELDALEARIVCALLPISHEYAGLRASLFFCAFAKAITGAALDARALGVLSQGDLDCIVSRISTLLSKQAS